MKLGKSVDDLQELLEVSEQKKDVVILRAIRPYWRKEILPKYLTFGRLAIGATIAFMLLDFKVSSGLLIAPLFLAGAVTYFIENVAGTNADKKTMLEKIVEPLANRMLVLPVLFYSLIVYNETLLFLIILLEIINGIVSLFAIDQHISLPKNIFTKSKMTVQLVILVGVLALWPYSPNIIFVGMLWISLIFMAISIIFKVVSITLHYETAQPKNIQYAFGEKRVIEAH